MMLQLLLTSDSNRLRMAILMYKIQSASDLNDFQLESGCLPRRMLDRFVLQLKCSVLVTLILVAHCAHVVAGK